MACCQMRRRYFSSGTTMPGSMDDSAGGINAGGKSEARSTKSETISPKRKSGNGETRLSAAGASARFDISSSGFQYGFGFRASDFVLPAAAGRASDFVLPMRRDVRPAPRAYIEL